MITEEAIVYCDYFKSVPDAGIALGVALGLILIGYLVGRWERTPAPPEDWWR